MTEDTRSLNPDCKDVQVGVKKTRTIRIYPLSISDQMKLTEKFTDVVNQFGNFDRENMTDAEAIDFIKGFLRDNLAEFMQYVIDEDEHRIPTLDELTNNQLAELADVVFRINYEDLIKNFKDLFGRAKGMMSTSQEQ